MKIYEGKLLEINDQNISNGHLEQHTKIHKTDQRKESQSADARVSQLERERQIFKHGVQMLHRKLKESQMENAGMRRTLADKDHECEINRQRANSNEAKAREFDQAKRRIVQLESFIL